MSVNAAHDDEHLVYENAHFRVEHSRDCLVPGYLIVTAKCPVDSLADLDDGAAQLLGPTLVLVTKVLEAIVQPEVIYCARFGEEVRALHFHIFPRTSRMKSEFPSTLSLSGPVVLQWARERYRRENATDEDRRSVADTIRAIRLRLKNDKQRVDRPRKGSRG